MQLDVDEGNSVSKRSRPLKKKKISGATFFLFSLAGIVAIGVGGFFALDYMSKHQSNSQLKEPALNSYKTIGKTELRASASSGAKIIATLKEETILSGKTAGKFEGVEWLEVTAADGSHGFLPINTVAQIGTNVDLSMVKNENVNIVTTTAINIRAIPSLTGQVLGTIDGGTRITTTGTIISQGEQWYRLDFGKDGKGFIMGRYTAPDEDKAALKNATGAGVGVVGIVNSITNLQATPFAQSRIIQPLLMNDVVSIIGQTKSDDWWYIVRLFDGTQGFVAKSAITIPASQNKWMYSDGTEAPAPNAPKAIEPANTIKADDQSAPESVKMNIGTEPPTVPNTETAHPAEIGVEPPKK
jgi:hypothetical protein